VSTGTDTFTDVYLANYYSLIRLAVLLLDDAARCEDVVQRAYVREFARRPRLRDETRVLGCLRQAVVTRSRATPRRHRPTRTPAGPSSAVDAQALAHIGNTGVVQTLRRLPRLQREVLALRFYAELSEAEVASMLQLSVRSVRAHASRGLDRFAAEMAGAA
jgi:RNA polymerase sigma factor (sigma-70 family)